MTAYTCDNANRLAEATLFTQTTKFRYSGEGTRVAVEVVGHGVTTYTVDYAGGGRILAESTPTSTVLYPYGLDCLGEIRDGAWTYYYIPDWRVSFEVDRPAGTGKAGWIIQQISHHWTVTKGNAPPDNVYWEAWPVDAGSTSINTASSLSE